MIIKMSQFGPDRVETQEVERTVNFCVYMPSCFAKGFRAGAFFCP